ncbi:hypothetical protein ACJX0J_010555, partial [Zea mays]
MISILSILATPSETYHVCLALYMTEMYLVVRTREIKGYEEAQVIARKEVATKAMINKCESLDSSCHSFKKKNTSQFAIILNLTVKKKKLAATVYGHCPPGGGGGGGDRSK